MRVQPVTAGAEVVRRLRRLLQARNRHRHGLLLVEGGTVLREALRAGLAVAEVIVSREALDSGRLTAVLDELAAAGVGVVNAAAGSVLASLSSMRTPHDLVAAVHAPRHGARDVPRVVALDGVQDPGNVGAILRAALAFGFEGAWLGEGSADAFQPKVLRASAGAVFHLAAVERVVLPEALDRARGSGCRVFGLDARRGTAPRGRRFPDRLVLVVGSEGRGPSPAVMPAVDEWLHIPLDPRVESLNAAVAAAIVLYEIARG